MKRKRTYSQFTREALRLLGLQVRLGRKKLRWSEMELAERAGVARATVQKIEKGIPATSIGLVFEVAVLVGIRLFQVESRDDLVKHRRGIEEQLTLLPKHTHPAKQKVDDAF